MSPGTVTLTCPSSAVFADPSSSAGVGGDGTCCTSSCSALDYQDNLNMVETFCSSNGQCISLTYSSLFSFTICTGDTLYVYNGNSTNSPLLTWGATTNAGANGFFTNITNTGPSVTTVTSSGPCITFKFVSDNDGQHAKGWRISFACVTCPSTPANDNYTGAQALSIGSTCTYTTGTTYFASSTATCSTAPACTASTPGNPDDDVWYTFTTGPSQTSATVTVDGLSPMDPVLQVFSGTCGSFTQVACVNTNSGAASDETTGSMTVTANTTYYVRVYDVGTFAGSNNPTNEPFQICVTGATNHDCSGATYINDPTCTSFTGSMSGGFGTQEYNSNGSWGCLFGEHSSLWYTFKPTSTAPFNFNIASNPTSSFLDCDWALWGPFSPSVDCILTTSNILASSYAVSNANPGCGLPGYSTGISYCETAGTYCEPAGGNGNIVAYVKELTVTAGKYYLLMIDLFGGNSNFTFNIPQSANSTVSCILPIELFTFTGQVVDDVNLLNWTTASETNNAYFAIQRSRDGDTFDSIGRLNGGGTSVTQLSYEFYDLHPIVGENFYRLKQVDEDGKFYFSGVIDLKNYGNDITIQSIYPNPTNGFTNVDVTSSQETDLELEVVNAVGQIVYTSNSRLVKGTNTLSFDLSQYADGIYYVTCQSACKKIKLFKKLMKM